MALQLSRVIQAMGADHQRHLGDAPRLLKGANHPPMSGWPDGLMGIQCWS
jgi:hypothetical protein